MVIEKGEWERFIHVQNHGKHKAEQQAANEQRDYLPLGVMLVLDADDSKDENENASVAPILLMLMMNVISLSFFAAALIFPSELPLLLENRIALPNCHANLQRETCYVSAVSLLSRPMLKLGLWASVETGPMGQCRNWAYGPAKLGLWARRNWAYGPCKNWAYGPGETGLMGQNWAYGLGEIGLMGQRRNWAYGHGGTTILKRDVICECQRQNMIYQKFLPRFGVWENKLGFGSMIVRMKIQGRSVKLPQAKTCSEIHKVAPFFGTRFCLEEVVCMKRIG
ncbi:hypothetical protein V8G54_012859 [Vigna mungo]|uniref:Uncharacterized protein n=1 Tax=Vigna mungo TaxID=3915 RepID=A0AAQ3NVN8_VIGMU